MIFNYSLHDATQWAAFSGDHNPIHFDLKQAQQLGLPQLTLHGMRAMLDIKYQLSQALLPMVPTTGFLRCNTRLRQPILYDAPYQLQLSQGRDQVSGILIANHNGEHCFSSRLRHSPRGDLTDTGTWMTVSSNEVYQFSQQFLHDATSPARCWGFFDALLFRLLITAPQTLAAAKQILPWLQAESLIDIFRSVPVIQTHHDVQFSADFMGTHPPHLLVRTALHYAVEPTLIVGDQHDGWILRATIHAHLDAGPVITTAVTLKTWPLAAN